MFSLENVMISIDSFPHKGYVILFTATGLFLSYFLVHYFRRTKVQVLFSNEKFLNFLNRAPSLKSRRFYPFPPISFAIGQCYLAGKKYENAKNLTQIRESFDYLNGGKGHVEWIIDSTKSTEFNSNLIAFILPEFCSKPNAPYLTDLYARLIENRIRPVVFIHRFDENKLVLPNEGPVDTTADIHRAVLYVRSKYPNCKLIGIGHSYGANSLVNYLAAHSKDNIFIAGISISNPYDFIGSHWQIRYRFIEKHAMYPIKELVSKNLDEIARGSANFKWSMQEIINATQLKEFDDAFMSKALGYKDAIDYYLNISSDKTIWDVQVPLISINAEDDPLVYHKGVPVQAHLKNNNLIFVLTRKGGHIGWVEGIFKLRRWYLAVVMEFILWILKSS